MEKQPTNERVLAFCLATPLPTPVESNALDKVAGGASLWSRTYSINSTQNGRDHVKDQHGD